MPLKKIEEQMKEMDIGMPMCNLVEYSDDYLERSGSLWQYYRDEPTLSDDGNIVNLRGNNASFKSKVKNTAKIVANSNT